MTSIPIGLSRDLPERRVMRALVQGHDLAVWRSASGRLTAWDNRCPHRGMRLSHGFVRGESLACLYHGWQYAAETGRCQHIPAHPDLEPPATICARAHPVAEAGGLIWVSVAGPLAIPQAGPATAPLRSITAEAGPEALRAALVATPLDGATPESVEGDTLLRVSIAGIALTAALQPLPEGQTTAHLLVAPGTVRADLTRLSRWSEEVRRAAEAARTVAPARQEEPA